MNTTNISILRHGEVQGGAIFRGSQNDPLTTLGWQQLQNSLNKISPNFDIVISSPLVRCADFARKYAFDNDLPLELIADLREIDFGQWEGKSFDELTRSDPENLEKFFSKPGENPAPAGENMSAFRSRVIAAVENVLKTYSGNNILLITHGGVLKVLISHALQMPAEALHKVDTPYACMTQFSVFKEQDRYSWLLKQHG